jgi:hypothetical protein
VESGAFLRLWLGSDRRTHALVGLWRVASTASGLALVAPIMLVGRRPYRLGRLADRLSDLEEMALIPDALDDQLSWFRYGLVVTVIGGLIVPARRRQLHAVVIAATLALAVLVRRGSGQTDWTAPTGQLTATIVLLAVATAAALSPAGNPVSGAGSSDPGAGSPGRADRIA